MDNFAPNVDTSVYNKEGPRFLVWLQTVLSRIRREFDKRQANFIISTAAVDLQANTGEQVLYSAAISAGNFITSGGYIDISAFGFWANTAGQKSIRVKVGTTVLFDSGAITAQNVPWCLELRIASLGKTGQIINGLLFYGNTFLQLNYSTSLDFTQAQTINLTGQSTNGAAADIVLSFYKLSYGGS